MSERPDPQSFIPGYRIRYLELETVCAWLKDNGWAGGIGFDEAVKAMAAAARSTPAPAEGLDVERLGLSAEQTAILRGHLASRQQTVKSDCPECGEWRDSPDADCANCGYVAPDLAPDRYAPREPV